MRTSVNPREGRRGLAGRWSNTDWDSNSTDRLWHEVGPLSGLGCDLGIHSVSPKAMGAPSYHQTGWHF